MNWVDTHAHLYAEEFNDDRHEMVQRAISAGVTKLLLPNIDESSIQALHDLVIDFPENCFPMMGLHPCYVTENYADQLDIVKKNLDANKYAAVGEIGLDLYWDKTSIDRQKDALRTQLGWASEMNLPVSLHTRDATDETIEIIKSSELKNLKGIFHCFSGTAAQARQIIDMGFLLGIGGVVTFKNSTLPEAIKDISIDHLVIETDAPYLAPMPYRGKRNESSYIPLIGEKLSSIYAMGIADVARTTTENANRVFNL